MSGVPKRRILYTAGLSHSGSTLLNMMLGAHPRVRGLGEGAHLAHDPEHQRKKEGNTPLWSSYYKAIDSGRFGDPVSRYELLVDLAHEHWGEDTILVDSSKASRYLATVRALPGVDLRAVLLTRDYRSWIVSRRDKIDRKEGGVRAILATYGLRPGLGRLRRWTRLGLARAWARENRGLCDELERTAIPYFRLGYEQLCFDTERRMRELCRFAGIEFDDAVLTPGGSRSEIIEGNRMYRDPEKAEVVRYDDRWLYRRDWIWLPLLLPGVDRLNAELVYGDGVDSVFEAS